VYFNWAGFTRVAWDGKIFVSNIEVPYRIRTKEKGIDSLK
jgi:nitrogen regulatory protein PII